MATKGNKTIVLDVPMTGEAVCVVFRNKSGKPCHSVVLFPPGSQTGFHRSDRGYEVTALTDVKLKRTKSNGRALPALELKQGKKIKRSARDASHNVINKTKNLIVIKKG